MGLQSLEHYPDTWILAEAAFEPFEVELLFKHIVQGFEVRELASLYALTEIDIAELIQELLNILHRLMSDETKESFACH